MKRINCRCLVPRGGETWYNLFAHALDSRIRVDIFRVVFRIIPAYVYTTDDGCVRCLRMLLPIVSEQTLYKTRVDALCTCTYVAMLHVHIVRVNDQQVRHAPKDRNDSAETSRGVIVTFTSSVTLTLIGEYVGENDGYKDRARERMTSFSSLDIPLHTHRYNYTYSYLTGHSFTLGTNASIRSTI